MTSRIVDAVNLQFGIDEPRSSQNAIHDSLEALSHSVTPIVPCGFRLSNLNRIFFQHLDFPLVFQCFSQSGAAAELRGRILGGRFRADKNGLCGDFAKAERFIDFSRKTIAFIRREQHRFASAS